MGADVPREFPHGQIEHEEVHSGSDAGSQGQGFMAAPEDDHKQIVETKVESEREKTSKHRQPALVDGIERGLQDFEPGIEKQAISVGAQSGSRLHPVHRHEMPAFEEHAHDGASQQHQPESGRNNEERHKAQALGEGRTEIRRDSTHCRS